MQDNMHEIDDETHVAHALFERFHDSHWAALYKLAYIKLGDEDEAYDLVQDFFIDLWNKRDVFPLDDMTTAWLHRRLWFRLLTYFRDRGFKQEQLENYRLYLESHMAFDQLSADGIYEQQFEVLMDAVSLIVAQMPERMQQIFILKKEQHYSVQEIADRLELSHHTVRNHLQAAMKRLRTSLKAQKIS